MPRPLLIRPNKTCKNLSNGDEEIELLAREGDAYDMDGFMQAGYEHSLPKKKKNKSHRFVLIFRHGNAASVPEDSGVTIVEMAEKWSPPKNGVKKQFSLLPSSGKDWCILPWLSCLRVKVPSVVFGHPVLVEGEDCLSRHLLYSTSAHR